VRLRCNLGKIESAPPCYRVDVHHRFFAALLSWSLLLSVSCQDRNPLEPGEIGTIDAFLQALQRQGLGVRLGDQLARESTPYFSVPARVVLVNGSHLNVFEYPSAEAAASHAALLTSEGQFRTVLITWISTPRFYRRDRLIVLYVGCSSEIIEALSATIGPPFAIGRTPCELSR
jgi:hypothetical protein